MPNSNPLSIICVSLLLLSACRDNAPQNVKLGKQLEPYYSLISQGQSGAARVRIRQYMDENTTTAQSLFLMGLSFHQEKRYSKAVEWFQRAAAFTASEDRYPPTWHFLGWSHFYQGNLNESNDAFEHFLELHPNESDSLFALGLIALEEGELSGAEQFFLKSISASQTEQQTEIQAKAKSRLGDVFEERGEFIKAIVKYDEAIALNPDLYESLYRKFTLLERLGRHEEAKNVLAVFVETKNRVRPEFRTTSFPE